MEFSLTKSIEILERTPGILFQMLDNISPGWTLNNEGEGTWSAFDVVGHLIHADRAGWLTRTEIILSDRENKTFPPLDRLAQSGTNRGKTMQQLLQELKEVRKATIDRLNTLNISSADLAKTGTHPSFGEVTLRQLLATWVVHDLDHISQIARVMAKQYKHEVGPWVEYLRIIKH